MPTPINEIPRIWITPESSINTDGPFPAPVEDRAAVDAEGWIRNFHAREQERAVRRVSERQETERQFTEGDHWRLVGGHGINPHFIREPYCVATPEQARDNAIRGIKNESMAILREMNSYIKILAKHKKAIERITALTLPAAETKTDRLGRIIESEGQ